MRKNVNDIIVNFNIDGYFNDNIPKYNETIDDYVSIKELLIFFSKYEIKFINKENSNSDEEHWAIFFFNAKENLFPNFLIGFNPKITKKRFEKFIKPLKDAFVIKNKDI